MAARGALGCRRALLAVRFFSLQVLRGEDYARHSEANAFRRVPVTAARGLIYDRDGRLLVDNRPSYALFLIPRPFLADSGAVGRLALRTGLAPQEILGRIEASATGPFTPVRLLRDMDFETLARIEENRESLPGLYVQVEPVRAYSDSLRLSHVLGYVGELTPAELKRRSQGELAPGDLVGKRGIERVYDAVLRGRRGYRMSLVNALGREIDNFGGQRDIRSVPGRDLRLTLDAGLQKMAEALLMGKTGSIVALAPATGEVLALANAPDFPLTPFARNLAPEVWDALLNQAGHPLLNRAIQAQLPPGSTYKLVTALAGFDLGVIDPADTVRCTGGWPVGRRFYPCWRPEGHGPVAFREAVAQSCNSYFYRLSQQIPLERWSHWGRRMGLGRATGIDLDGETSGLLPDIGYMDAKYGKGRWSLGQLANLAIGQGDLLVTPLQMARVTALLAMNGRGMAPRLIQAEESRQGGWQAVSGSVEESVAFPASSRSLILQGMREAVASPQGTALAAAVPGVAVCGKTGSAQNPQGESHAWFVGFAPMENPEIVLAVVVEHGGSGGRAAAPLAGQLFRHYFEKGGSRVPR